MIEKMCEEIELRFDYLQDKNLGSIYFGGGTPSLLKFTELEQLFKTIRKYFNFDQNAEITLEANPDDISLEKIKEWKALGINRFSVGLQSFKKEDLKWMNRAHQVEDGYASIALLKSHGISNISVDLIYGLPELSDKDWKEHLQNVIELQVPHISSYCLTVEPKTALDKLVRNKTLLPANEEAQERQFLMMSEILCENGFQHYEISNFALPGKKAVHNSNYWKGVPYLGIGPSAHSFDGKTRRWNVSNNPIYIKSVGVNEEWFEEEVLTEKDQWNETILTGLRTSWGISMESLQKSRFYTTKIQGEIKQMIDFGLAKIQSGSLQLTTNGMLQADALASKLFV
jgi:oxygen-independent coproporphyrinogen-3 oxidase